jgi:dTDP-4-amino-4,6-dideoxygalactose transaminase
MQFVDLKAQHDALKPELDRAIAQVIDSSAFIRGPAIDEFEQKFAELIGVKHCVSCANGTDAIYIALRALGLQLGDEVITTAHSWIATSETITQAGGKVVFCDTEDDYFCIDPSRIEALITEKTKGIIVVHLYGQAADMDPIMEIAKRRGLWVIEDTAQSHIAEYKGRKLGTIGDVATFSFYPGKNLGAMGDAGCLVTNREDIADFATLFARHGGKNNHVMEGINSRMDGIQAAILNVKMKYLEEWTVKREFIAAEYSKLLQGIPGLVIPAVRTGCRHVFHLYVIRCKKRDELQAALSEVGIPTVINYPRALPFYDAYSYLDHKPADFSVAYRHAQEILSLPIHPYLEKREVQQVAQAISQYLDG